MPEPSHRTRRPAPLSSARRWAPASGARGSCAVPSTRTGGESAAIGPGAGAGAGDGHGAQVTSCWAGLGAEQRVGVAPPGRELGDLGRRQPGAAVVAAGRQRRRRSVPADRPRGAADRVRPAGLPAPAAVSAAVSCGQQSRLGERRPHGEQCRPRGDAVAVGRGQRARGDTLDERGHRGARVGSERARGAGRGRRTRTGRTRSRLRGSPPRHGPGRPGSGRTGRPARRGRPSRDASRPRWRPRPRRRRPR